MPASEVCYKDKVINYTSSSGQQIECCVPATVSEAPRKQSLLLRRHGLWYYLENSEISILDRDRVLTLLYDMQETASNWVQMTTEKKGHAFFLLLVLNSSSIPTFHQL